MGIKGDVDVLCGLLMLLIKSPTDSFHDLRYANVVLKVAKCVDIGKLMYIKLKLKI